MDVNIHYIIFGSSGRSPLVILVAICLMSCIPIPAKKNISCSVS